MNTLLSILSSLVSVITISLLLFNSVQNTSKQNLAAVLRIQQVPAGGTGFSSTSPNSIIVSGSTATSSLQATSSNPLYVGAINASSTSLDNIFQGALRASSTATSTMANGIQLYGGCFRDIGGSCIVGGSGADGTFSTTSANYWDTTISRWATTSTDYWKTQNEFFSTTSADSWKSNREFHSTTSSNYWLTTKTTDNLTQGSSNLYWSNLLWAGQLAGTTTSALAEGNNLYWTNTRFDNRLSASSSIASIITLGNLSLPISQLTGTLGVANGGTGQTSFTSSQLLYGNGTLGLSNVATSSASCSGSVSCSAFTVVGSVSPTITSSASLFAWTPRIDGNATTTRILLDNGFISSASSTIMGNLNITGVLRGSSTATSTMQNGINLVTGCFSINSVCVGGGGGGSSNWTDSGTYLTPLTLTDGLIISASSTFSSNLLISGTLNASSTIVAPAIQLSDGYALTKGLLSVNTEILSATSSSIKSVRGFKNAVTIRQIDAVMDCLSFCKDMVTGGTVTPIIEASTTLAINASSGTSFTTALTVPTGKTYTIVVAAFSSQHSLYSFGIKWRGAELTGGGGATTADNNGYHWWYLNSTTTSDGQTYNIEITKNNLGNMVNHIYAISGHDVSGANGNPAYASTSRSTWTATPNYFQSDLTSNTDDLIIQPVTLDDLAKTVSSFNTGQNPINALYLDANYRSFDSKKTATSTGNVSMGGQLSGSTAYAAVAIDFKPITTTERQGITFNLRHGTDRSASTTATSLFTNPIQLTSSTTLVSFTSGFNDATLAANEMLWVDFDNASNTPMNVPLDIYYTID